MAEFEIPTLDVREELVPQKGASSIKSIKIPYLIGIVYNGQVNFYFYR